MTDLDIVKVTEDALGVRLPHLAQFESKNAVGKIQQQNSGTPYQPNGDDAIEMSNVAASSAADNSAALQRASEHHTSQPDSPATLSSKVLPDSRSNFGGDCPRSAVLGQELQEVVVDGTADMTRKQNMQRRQIGQVSSKLAQPAAVNSDPTQDFNFADVPPPVVAPVLRFLGSTKTLLNSRNRHSDNASTSTAHPAPVETPPPSQQHMGAGAPLTATTIGGSQAVPHPRFKRSTKTSLTATLRRSQLAASASSNPADLSPCSRDASHAPAEALDIRLEIPPQPPRSRSCSRPSRPVAAFDQVTGVLELNIPRQPPPRSRSRRAVESPEHTAGARVQVPISSQQQNSAPIQLASRPAHPDPPKLSGASVSRAVAAKQLKADIPVAKPPPRSQIGAAGSEDDEWAQC